MRKVIFWLHLTVGVTAGLVILLMSATGVLLTYEKQMIAWADRTDAALPVAASDRRQPVDALIAAARRGDADATVSGLTISSIPGAPALATVEQRTIALNPFTGLVLGESAPRLRAFFRSVTSWHRDLGAATGPLRQTMRAITGWSNLLFLLIVIGGLYLWIPRKWTMTQLRAVTWVKGGLRGKARDFNWHNAIGVWCCMPLVLVVLGAMPISFPWANRAVYRLVGEAPPVPAGQGAQPAGRERRSGGPDGGARRAALQAPVERLWQTAEQQVQGWRTISARFGGSSHGPLVFTIDRGAGGQPQLRSTLTVDRATGSVVRLETFDDQSAGRRVRSFLRFAHTGEYFGLAGQTIAGLASAGAVVLVWTGLSLALRRVRAWRARRRDEAAPAAAHSCAA